MLTWIGVALLVVMAGLFLSRRGASSLGLARQAAESGDLAPLIAAAEALAPPARSAFFHESIGYLWSNWQRPLAAELTRAYAERCPEETLVQFWLRQVLEVEPGAAREVMDEPFLTRYFRPEVAKQCRSGGS